MDHARALTTARRYAGHRDAARWELDRALRRGEFTLRYQPIALLSTGRVVGMEALARWQHPIRGLLCPGEFLPNLDRMGRMPAFTSWALSAAVAQLRRWQESGLKICVSVNVTPADVTDRLAHRVEDLLLRSGLDGAALKLEVTETAAIRDIDGATQVLKEIRGLGVRIALDDFGTGGSSLTWLRLPVQELKVDRSFVAGADAGSARDLAIVRGAILMAHDLGLKVVAEGVETKRAWRWLKALGCDAAQGYYIGRPESARTALEMAGRLV